MFNNSGILSYLSSPLFFFLNVIVFDIAIELGSQFIFHQFLSHQCSAYAIPAYTVYS